MRVKDNRIKGVAVKDSIRTQFTLLFFSVMALVILFLVAINNIFLERVYLGHKKTAIKEAYASINTASASGDIQSDEYDLELQRICERYDIELIVLDTDSQTVKVSAIDAEFLARVLWDNMQDDTSPASVIGKRMIQEETEKYTLQIETDRRSQTDYMVIWGFLDNGNLVLVRGALESVKDSVRIANNFLIIIGVIAVFVGTISSQILGGRFTKPILELTKISEDMKELNFEVKYQAGGKGRNELDVLGENINELSEALETTIRELKNANIELKQDIELKEKIDEMRRDFISNVSHELKTPIALIQGYAEGLQENINDDPESRAYYCEVILDEAARMSTMVKSLLSLNQLESGGNTVTMDRFDISALIRDYVRSVELMAKQKKATIEFEDTGETYVWADEFKTGEVVQNYVSNAFNHVEENGEIRVWMKVDSGKVRISVFNTGKPIPEDSLPHIWEKFYKVDKARTREYGGSGVGLSIVKAIMDSMGGAYGAQNYDNGVEFWFELETR